MLVTTSISKPSADEHVVAPRLYIKAICSPYQDFALSYCILLFPDWLLSLEGLIFSKDKTE